MIARDSAVMNLDDAARAFRQSWVMGDDHDGPALLPEIDMDLSLE